MIVRHIVSVVGLSLGALGGFYLSYDLLGKPGGLLRRFMIAISSSILSIGVVIYLGPYLFIIGPIRDFIFLHNLTIPYFLLIPAIFFIIGLLKKPPKANITTTHIARIRGFRGFLYEYESGPVSFILELISFPLLFGIYYLSIKLPQTLLIEGILGILALACILGIFSLAGLLLTVLLSDDIPAYLNNLPERHLGAIGAFLTLLAFTIQLGLELTS